MTQIPESVREEMSNHLGSLQKKYFDLGWDARQAEIDKLKKEDAILRKHIKLSTLSEKDRKALGY